VSRKVQELPAQHVRVAPILNGCNIELVGVCSGRLTSSHQHYPLRVDYFAGDESHQVHATRYGPPVVIYTIPYRAVMPSQVSTAHQVANMLASDAADR